MTLRSANIERIDGGYFDVLVVGGGINGAVAAASLAGRGASVALVDRGDFAGFTSQESSNLVWGGFKYLENYELPPGAQAVHESRNRLMKAYPANVKEIGFLAALDARRPLPALVGRAGRHSRTGASATSGPSGRGVFERRERSRPRSRSSTPRNVRGGIEYHDAYLKDNDARFVFCFVRSALDAGAVAANYVELARRRTRRRTAGMPTLRDIDTGAEITYLGPRRRQRGRALRRRPQRRSSASAHRAPHRLLQGHPSRRPPAHDDPTRAGARVLRRHPAALLRDPDGPAVGHRHHRHPRRRPRTPRSPTRTGTFLLDQINARLDLAAPLTVDDIIAERCGVRPLVVTRTTVTTDRRRLDLAVAQARDRGRPRPRRSSPSSAASSPTASTSARRSPTRCRRSASPSRRTGTLVRRARGASTRTEFYRQARLMRLDDLRDQARRRAAQRSSVATLRPAGVRDARGHPGRPGDGRGHHGLGRLPPRRAAPRRRAPRWS